MAAAAAVDRRPEGPPSSWPYPFAAAADTVRAQQKDAYFTAQVTDALAELYRCLAGARAAHARAAELRALAALFYLGLTTLPGNRTLGEEYCDLIQVRAPTARLPSLRVRTAYVVVAAAGPFLPALLLPRSTAWLRSLIDRRRDALRARRQPIASPASPVPSSPHIGGGACSPSAPSCYEARLLDYLARNLPALTSTAPLQALSLVLFYLHGSYYELPKRLLSLRYIFTRSVPDTPDRAGYEVLGFLLVIQLAVQAYLHLRANLVPSPSPSSTSTSTTSTSSSSPSRDLLIPDLAAHALQVNRVDIASTTHTPPAHRPRIDLANPVVMPYICGPQQRKCTLCLEELKDPSATSCGHIFCWLCIADWVREKPECPLCRREAMVQHILPLRIL